MTLWIIDTDCLSLFQQKHPLVTRRVRETKPEEIAITVITVEEQIRGWLNVIRQESKSERLIWAYQGLGNAVRFFNQTNLLNFDRVAYLCYQDLKNQKISIGTQDLRIASIVLSVEGILVTRNRRDFEQVPGLSFEDWTIVESGLE